MIQEYVKEYCPVDRYQCLMPVEYTCIDDEDKPGRKSYRKVRCCCHNVREGKCSREAECAHFQKAAETIVR